MSSATFYKWKAKYAGLEVWDAKRLKALMSIPSTDDGLYPFLEEVSGLNTCIGAELPN
jgi:hypothetical protein